MVKLLVWFFSAYLGRVNVALVVMFDVNAQRLVEHAKLCYVWLSHIISAFLDLLQDHK